MAATNAAKGGGDYLLVAIVVRDLEVPELGLHVVVLLGDAAELLRELLVAFLVASVGLLVTLQAKGKHNPREEYDASAAVDTRVCGRSESCMFRSATHM